jgi:hypothetical protein
MQCREKCRFELIPLTVNGSRRGCTFREKINFNALVFRIDNPKFLNTGSSVNAMLANAIKLGSLGRENLNYEIGRALGSGVGENR